MPNKYPNGCYVDFSKTGLPYEVVAKMIQDVAFSNGISWVSGSREYFLDCKSIGLVSKDEGLIFNWMPRQHGEPITLSAFLAYLVEQGQPTKPVKKEKSWLDDLAWKQVLVWDSVEPGTPDWKICVVESFTRVGDSYCLNSSVWGHMALLTGYEYRCFLPYDQWANHDCEV
jgi:hypothetical protein